LLQETLKCSAASECGCSQQTIMPDSTLCAHPWLAELGDSALGETLSDLSGVERSAYEYAWLPVGEAVTARSAARCRVEARRPLGAPLTSVFARARRC